MAPQNSLRFEGRVSERWKLYLNEHASLRKLFEVADVVSGNLLRPTVLFESAQAAGNVDDPRITEAALAVQCIHVASLLHDDVLDDAVTRRGTAAPDTKTALLLGDLLITAAYDLAARAGVSKRFARAVHRMSCGEARQGLEAKTYDRQTYREVITEKSGALFGFAMAAPWDVRGDSRHADLAESLGDGLGRLYQLLDDFLDWCPATDTGKPPLQDARQGKRTLPLFEYRGSLQGAPEDMAALLFADGAMHRASAQIEHEALHWKHAAETILGARPLGLSRLADRFAQRAAAALQENESSLLKEPNNNVQSA